jgi:hypothetical protein
MIKQRLALDNRKEFVSVHGRMKPHLDIMPFAAALRIRKASARHSVKQVG